MCCWWCDERRPQALGKCPSPTQRSAVINLGQGALPWINRAFGRKPACPSTWITFITARALVREGVATIRISSCGSWLRLTPRGHYYARLLAEAAEAKSVAISWSRSSASLAQDPCHDTPNGATPTAITALEIRGMGFLLTSAAARRGWSGMTPVSRDER
jgi:hypothetical protein